MKPPNLSPRWLAAALAVGVLASTSFHASAQTVFSDSAGDAAGITATVDAFRAALGTLNPPEPVNAADGRRQINWDAAPDSISAPNVFPGDFFNFNAAPRARGIEFSTFGPPLQLSATAASGVGIEFDNLNDTYSETFEAFSAERLFSPAFDTNVTQVHFFDPADPATPATVDGLGVVFSDVDFIGFTSMEFFDANDDSLGKFDVPSFFDIAQPNEHFSFLGVQFDDPVVARVEIVTGSVPLGPDEDNNNSIDLVVMDDFIFGEPVRAIPEPSSLLLVVVGLLAGLGRRLRR